MSNNKFRIKMTVILSFLSNDFGDAILASA